MCGRAFAWRWRIAVFQEEVVKRRVESLEVFVAMNEERAQGRANVIEAREAHPLQRLNGIDQAAVVNVDPDPAQRAAEAEDV